MNRLGLFCLLALGACGTDVPTENTGAQTAPVSVPTSGNDSIRGRVLVDASRDGGVWWFPQVAPFSATEGHQGIGLAEFLRSLGYAVDELPRPFLITTELLNSYDVVIRANGFGSYVPSEIAAYQDYVTRGGNLLLLADHMQHTSNDVVMAAFGIEFAGVTRGENALTTFSSHPIADSVTSLSYMVGSGIVSLPAGAEIVGRLSGASFLDLDKNGRKDATDPSAPAVLGAMPYGAGRIVFCGDVNLWEHVPTPLLQNVLEWF